MRDVRLDVVGAVEVEELPVFVAVVEPLARRERDAHALLHLAHSVQVVRRERLFEPADVELLQPPADPDRRRDVEPAVSLDHQQHVLPDGFGDFADALHRGIQFAFADLLPRFAERVPLAAEELVLPDLFRFGREFVRRLRGRKPTVDVDRNRVAHLAAEQLIDRNAERFALDVPERHFDARQGAHQHRAAAPVGVAVAVVAEEFDVVRIFADQPVLQLVDRRGHGQFAILQRRFPPTVDS